MDGSCISNVRKIALLRATALGDLIFALPAIEALRAAYPQAELVYLGRRWHVDFLSGRLPGSHRVIAVPPPVGADIARGLVIDPAAEDEFFPRMQAEAFDLALQMHGGGVYSNPFICRLKARFSVGLKAPNAVPLDRWVPYVYYQNEVVRLLEVVALIGAGPADGAVSLTPRLPLLASDLEAAAAVLEEIRAPFVVLHPGSTDPRRRWQPEKFAAVGDFCAAQGLQVVLCGASSDAAQVQAVQARMHAPAANLCSRLSLPGLAGLLSQAALFIGNDSGPLHLALAVGARAVGLFWVEYILNSMPLTRSSFYPLIAWRRTCPICGATIHKAEIDSPAGPCTHEVSFLDELAAEDAVSAVKEMLSRGEAQAGG
ncbi:MAG: glycosyltransferase family 9 protein [Chloroflexi bacterium]|nr:glycosyltransferase family 9 protein [Chloroflexota bacterium]